MAVSTSSATLFDQKSQHRALLGCVGASIALHAAVLVAFPQLRTSRSASEPQKILTATLLSPSQPAPVAEEPPTPVAEPRPRPRPKPAVTPDPRPVMKSPVPEPEPASAPEQTASAAPEPATPIPAPAAPVAESATKNTVELLDGKTLQEYRLGLMASAKQFKRYPAQAMERGWEGRVEIRITVRPTGAIESAAIKTPSGYQILDDQALEMVKRAQSRTPIPPSLRGREFSVDIPVIFELQSG